MNNSAVVDYLIPLFTTHNQVAGFAFKQPGIVISVKMLRCNSAL